MSAPIAATRPGLAPAKKPRRIKKSETQAVDVLARTIYGEARGESLRGREAVANVVMNRVKIAQAAIKKGGRHWWGKDVVEVCRKPLQFSCWNPGDPNLKRIKAASRGDRDFETCLRIARRAIAGVLGDVSDGATHYHAHEVFPLWARGKAPCAEIGGHLFYNDIE